MDAKQMANRYEGDFDDPSFATFLLDCDRGFEGGGEESGHD